jgi:rSAM/selenodomain-associated transferase 2
LISVVIPALDEEAGIESCIRSLAGAVTPYEVLVVDGGSRDATRSRAERAGARVLSSPPGRSVQMNRGAAAAEGSVLLFLHADMQLPPGGLDAVQAVLEDPEVAGGGFYKLYHPTTLLLWLLAWGHNVVRAGWFRDLVGTNAPFVRRSVFEALGGFPAQPFLEDVVFSDRLKEVGKVAIVRVPVRVSARKYLRDGVLRRTFRNIWIMVQFRLFGRSPDQLARQYR